MIYQCEKCKANLPPRVFVCPKCGDTFEEAVPQDAEVSKPGWSAKHEAGVPSSVLPQSSQVPTNNSTSGLQKFLAYAGVTALAIGITLIVYYLNFFSVTVTTAQVSILGQPVGGGEVNNVGLLSDRQNGLIIGISMALLGVILLIAGIFVDVRNGAKNLSVGSLIAYAVILFGVLGASIYGTRKAKYQQIIRAGDKQAINNLKAVGLGIMMYTQDYDETFPPMDDVLTFQDSLKPYISKGLEISREASSNTLRPDFSSEQFFLNPVTHRPFTLNSKCSGIILPSIADPSSLIVMYDEVPEPNGTRLVLYADGHSRRATMQDWSSIMANKKPNRILGSSEEYRSNDTLIPSEKPNE